MDNPKFQEIELNPLKINVKKGDSTYFKMIINEHDEIL